MELLNGKCLQDFEKWYFDNHCQSNLSYEQLLPHHYQDVFGWFYGLDISFQIGVYEDFFESKGLMFEVQLCLHPYMSGVKVRSYLPSFVYKGVVTNMKAKFMNRTQARTEAIKHANNLYNKNYDLYR